MVRRSWKDEGASGSAGPCGKSECDMFKLSSSSSGLWYVGDCCGGGTAAFFCVDNSHANLLLAVGWLGALLGVWVSSDRIGLCDVPLVREEPRLKRLVIMLPLSSSSSSDSES